MAAKSAKTCAFLDTSAIFAIADADDAAHEKSLELYEQTPRFLCHTAIVLEAFSLICKRISKPAAVEVIGALRGSPKIELVHVERELLEAAWHRCLEFTDKEWDWIDCVSFEVMDRRGIRSALTLDHHFRQAGFEFL